MTETPQPNRCRRNSARRLLAAMAALSLLVAACTGDPADDVAGDQPPASVPPSTTTGAAGDAGGNSADPDADEAADDSGATATSAATATDSDASASADGGSSEDGSSNSGKAGTEDAGAEDSGVERSAAGEATGDDSASSRPVGTGGAAALRQSGECDAVADYVREHVAQAAVPWASGGADEMFEEAAASADDAAFAELASPQPGVDYSTSNVQEAGIDEPDVLKTDGRRMVIASEHRVHIVDVTGPEPALIASVPFDDIWVSNLLLHGDRVLVFASQWDVIVPFAEPGDITERGGPSLRQGPTTGIVEIDLSGPEPTVGRRLDIEGSYISARMTDGVVRVVTNAQPHALAWAGGSAPSDASGQDQAAGADHEAAAAASVADDWLPRFALRDGSGSAVAGGRLADCDRVWIPPHYAGAGTLSVTTIDVASDGLAGPMDTTSILSDASTVYASRDRLYVSTTRWPDWRAGPADAAGEPVETEVHMFDTTGRTASIYVGSASVTGTVLNQYSMSEHEGHLRVATTTAPARWTWRSDSVPDDGGPDSESLVTVFAVSDDGLSEVGRVGGLGVGERIFAVRYLGDIAAVVTFRQVDPLYLLDLSDPVAPEVRGELKITGYSAYLHPLGGDLLLGVGQEATGEGFAVGTQVSLFDIADLDRPQRIAQWTAAGGHSQAEFNALAFLHWQPSSLAVLPLNQHPFDDSGSEAPFVGAVALDTAGTELTERARFSHAFPPLRTCRESREITVRPDGSEVPGSWERHCWYTTDWQAQVTASAVVGDRLYLASHKALESVWLDSLERASLLPWSR